MNDPASKPVLVLGGGVAGLTAAQAMAGNGLSVVLVEKQPALGGHAAAWSCMATEGCQKCSSCLALDARRAVLDHPRIRVLTRATLQAASRQNGSLQVRLGPSLPDSGHAAGSRGISDGEPLEKPEELTVEAVFLATGFEPFAAAGKPMLNYGRLAPVLTTVDLNRLLRENRLASLPVAAAPDPRVAFLLCVGSRDREAGRDYCSQVCCRTSLRMATRLLHEMPACRITVFYIDLQIMGKGFREFYREVQGKVRFVQGVPGEILPAADGQVALTFEDPPGAVRTESFDLAVLAVGVTPGAETATLATTLGLAVEKRGFFQGTEDAAPGGIAAIGSCCAPMDIPTASREALAMVGRYLEARRKS